MWQVRTSAGECYALGDHRIGAVVHEREVAIHSYANVDRCEPHPTRPPTLSARRCEPHLTGLTPLTPPLYARRLVVHQLLPPPPGPPDDDDGEEEDDDDDDGY